MLLLKLHHEKMKASEEIETSHLSYPRINFILLAITLTWKYWDTLRMASLRLMSTSVC